MSFTDIQSLLGSSISPSSSSDIDGSFWDSDRKKARTCNTSHGDMNFSEMINNTRYEHLKDVEATYKIYVHHPTVFGVHWFLLIKKKDSELPFFSLEISTPDGSTIRHEMFSFDEYEGEQTYCGEITGKLEDILNVADRCIIDDMGGKYKMYSSNCQHFCNNFLHRNGFETYRTTLGKRLAIDIKLLLPQSGDIAELLKMLEADAQLKATIDEPLGSTILKTVESRFEIFLGGRVNAYIEANRR